MHGARGFTLVEMMVALGIFAMLALAGGMLMQQSVAARQAMAESGSRLAALQLARAAMKADFSQLVARAARDPYGGDEAVAFQGGDAPVNGPLLRLVRGGWENPGNGEARGGLQYVEYDAVEGRLIRRARLRLDAMPATPVRERVLLDGVSAVSVSFLANGQWLPGWGTGGGRTAAAVLPEAVAIEFELEAFGPVRQVFLTARGAG